MPVKADELIVLIENAFPKHPIPERTLRQVTLSDQGIRREISEEEWERAGRLDRDVPWAMLSDNDLMECADGVAHLWGPELTYYLGALLCFAVRHLDSSISTREWSLAHSVLFLVTYNHADRRDFDRHWAWLNASQIEVVRRFLEHVAARSERFRGDARRALDRYWNEARPVEPDYCPVCAYALPLPPKGDDSPRTDMCHCCGIRFGIDMWPVDPWFAARSTAIGALNGSAQECLGEAGCSETGGLDSSGAARAAQTEGIAALSRQDS